jgi:hypothetical protein
MSRDGGELSDKDVRENLLSPKERRLPFVERLPHDQRLEAWIITEADRDSTRILLPSCLDSSRQLIRKALLMIGSSDEEGTANSGCLAFKGQFERRSLA